MVIATEAIVFFKVVDVVNKDALISVSYTDDISTGKKQFMLFIHSKIAIQIG
jgi:hypothetical protein